MQHFWKLLIRWEFLKLFLLTFVLDGQTVIQRKDTRGKGMRRRKIFFVDEGPSALKGCHKYEGHINIADRKELEQIRE